MIELHEGCRRSMRDGIILPVTDNVEASIRHSVRRVVEWSAEHDLEFFVIGQVCEEIWQMTEDLRNHD